MKSKYRIQIVSTGSTFDVLRDHHNEEHIYKITTYTFRLLDSQCMTDWFNSQPVSWPNWEDDWPDKETAEAEEAKRAKLREYWEHEIVRLLTGGRTDETTGWTITNVLAEIFAAATITEVSKDGD